MAGIVLILCSCEGKTKTVTRTNIEKFLVKDISIPYSDKPVFKNLIKHYLDTSSGMEYIMPYDKKNREVYLFNLTENTFLNKFPLPGDMVKDEIGICAKNSKQIFVLYCYYKVLRLMDQKGKVLNEWDLGKPLTKAMGGSVQRLESSLFWPFFRNENGLFAYAYHDGSQMSKELNKKLFWDSYCYKINPRPKSVAVEKINRVFPKFWIDYRKKYSSGPMRFKGKNNSIIYCSMHCDTCYIYHPETKQTDTVRTPISSFEPPGDFDSDKFHDLTYVQKYLNKNDRYRHIVYDPYRDLYYRVLQESAYYGGKTENLKSAGVYHTIGIFDSEFNPVKEILIPPDTYYPYNMTPGKKGVYLGKNQALKKKIFQLTSINYGLFKF